MKTYFAAGAFVLMVGALPSSAQPPAGTITGTPGGPTSSQPGEETSNAQVQKLLVNPGADQTLPAHPGEAPNPEGALHGPEAVPQSSDAPPPPAGRVEAPPGPRLVLPQCATPPLHDEAEPEIHDGAPCAMRCVIPF